MTHAFDIVVVGAGMVGAALATGLGQQGFRVCLIDRLEAPAFDPDAAPDIRVSALSAGSQRYLDSLDAWDQITSMRSTPYRRLAVWDETRHPLSKLMPRQLTRVEFDAAGLGGSHLGHIVENSVTQRALWQSAQAQDTVTTLTGLSVVALEENDTTATLILDDGQRLEAQLVVGADGAQSKIRDLAGIGINRNQYAQQAMVMSVRYQGPVDDITWQGFCPSGPRAFLPLHSAEPDHPGESWASLVWYDSPEELARLKALPEEHLLQDIQTAFPPELPQLTHLEARASFPIARQHAKRYFSGRVVLAGDSAHTINPLAGQGVNLGFQDAQCLQGQLKEAARANTDLADPAWLQQYEALRRPANRRMMMTMDLFYHLFSNRVPPLHLLRNLGLGAARALPFARNQVARYAMGIDERLPAGLSQLIDRIPGLRQL
ncbi:FAD-dependent monooxygenase [Marinobacter similis]|uniref:Ubiquinone biosynthesis protein UbiH n=1 Tax=Marinobacter similis TaxID=1420916 RepID=W5YHJ6_9GAMM|nr:FAD-dependent monooxygenase [Marinobacter similis]AHI28561.1 ubiquinone biosynthesis protein UbiH [Marinobacter similis]